MRPIVLLCAYAFILVAIFCACDYEGALVETPEQVEKPEQDSTKKKPGVK